MLLFLSKLINIIKKLIPFSPTIETCALSDNIFKAIKELTTTQIDLKYFSKEKLIIL